MVMSEALIMGVAAAGALIASIFLSPPSIVYGAVGLIVMGIGIGLLMKAHWVESKPNEWLLVIRNGQLMKSGVGLKTLTGFQDTVVRLSLIHI